MPSDLVLLPAITVTYRRSPGPLLERLTPAPTLSGGYPMPARPYPGRSAPGADRRAGDGLARYPSPGWVWCGVSDRPGGPGFIRPTSTASYLCPRVLRMQPNERALSRFSARREGDGPARDRRFRGMERFWWRVRDSNPRPPRCERGALPTELTPHPAVMPGRCFAAHPSSPPRTTILTIINASQPVQGFLAGGIFRP